MSEDQPLQIDIFSDYVCPWCYLSTAAVEKIQHDFHVKINWIPFPLHPSTPEQGLSLNELFGGRNMDQAHDHLRQRMAQEGLEYVDREYTYNSRKAQELAMWAKTQPGGDAIHKALFRAYFVGNRNLAVDEVLLDAVQEAGLDVEAAKQVLQQRLFENAVDECWQKAKQQRISAVPTFVAKGYMVTGAQTYEELKRFVDYVISQTNAAH